MFVCTCTRWYKPFVSATDRAGTSKTYNACILHTHDNQSALIFRVLSLNLSSLVFVELCVFFLARFLDHFNIGRFYTRGRIIRLEG